MFVLSVLCTLGRQVRELRKRGRLFLHDSCR